MPAAADGWADSPIAASGSRQLEHSGSRRTVGLLKYLPTTGGALPARSNAIQEQPSEAVRLLILPRIGPALASKVGSAGAC